MRKATARGDLTRGGAGLREQIAHASGGVAAGTALVAAAPAPAAAQAINVKQGTLVWQGEGKKRKRVLQAPSNKLPYQLNNPKEIKATLTTNTSDAVEVDFEIEKGQPVRIRPRGEPWDTGAPLGAAAKDRFANPYYFLPHHDREGFKGELADGPGRGHERYIPGTYSGTIRIRLKAEAPLILCDTDPENVRECKNEGDPTFPPNTKPGHKVYPVAERDGKPHLASSSVRGMLRSAFEAVTNSRFGVFPCSPERGNANTRRLGYRPPASSGLAIVPVRIENHDGAPVARLLSGTTTISGGGTAPGQPVFAALVARYDRHWRMPEGAALGHGTEAWAYLTPWEHNRFRFWNVEALRTGDAQPTAAPDPRRFRPARQSARPATGWGSPQWVRGWVCVSERNIDRKHDERFFFHTGSAVLTQLAPGVPAQWARLIENYQEIHEPELAQGVTRPPALHSSCRFSRHISHDLRTVARAERELLDGTLCYAVVRGGAVPLVEALYPVMISRRLFDCSPADLLPLKLHPARTADELSPADRVFGWVSQAAEEGAGPAYRSHVRVGPVTCDATGAIERFQEPRALAILGEPKPQQGRFYLGKKDGHFASPQSGTTKEESGYRSGNRVRGPKVYPHHRKFEIANAITSERSNQNRSVEGWIKPGTEFEFDLRVTNLSRFELGALVWLLGLPEDHFHRLGLGKPLGFGSARVDFDQRASCVAEGSAWVAVNGAWDARPIPTELAPLASAFEADMSAANPRLLKAFLLASGGVDGLPVHYPRLPGQGAENGEHFEWFVANERESNRPGERGQRVALPDLTPGACSLPSRPN